MASIVTVRHLAARARVTRVDVFADEAGELVLIGPRGALEARDASWTFMTRHGRGDASSNPITELLDSDALCLRKADGAPFGNTILIGRAHSNDICIDESSISKLHARIDAASYALSDAGSTNGTFVGDTRLRANDRVTLAPNLDVRFGDRVFRVYASRPLHATLARLPA